MMPSDAESGLKKIGARTRDSHFPAGGVAQKTVEEHVCVDRLPQFSSDMMRFVRPVKARLPGPPFASQLNSMFIEPIGSLGRQREKSPFLPGLAFD